MKTEEIVVELIVYKLLEKKTQEFAKLHAQIADRLAALPGFVRAEHRQSLEDSLVFADQIIWADQASAEAAYKAYAKFPEAQAFETCVEDIYFGGHFK